MKKILMVSLFCSLILSGCNLTSEDIVANMIPYKEYKLIEKDVVEVLEKTIFETKV